MGRLRRLLISLDFDGFGNCHRIFLLDTENPNGAVNLRVTQP